jgi:hypothetical protein
MSFSKLPTALSRAVIGTVLAAAVALAPASAEAQGRRPSSVPFNVVPITINNVALVGEQLVATGVAGTQPITALLDLTATANPAGSCPILNLHLAPINLNVLGLVVETSDICLDITAHQGGGLLGDLLCGIGGSLLGGHTLSEALGALTAEQLAIVTNGLTTILNQGVFIPLSSSSAVVGASCNILNLAIGPVDLNLLGLQVELDNCHNGPVTLDITANPAGGLLGQLLCSLAGLLSNPLGAGFLLTLQRIAALIGLLLA